MDVADVAVVPDDGARVEFLVFSATAVAEGGAAHKAMFKFATVAPDDVFASDDDKVLVTVQRVIPFADGAVVVGEVFVPDPGTGVDGVMMRVAVGAE